jgi:ribonuclease P protein component
MLKKQNRLSSTFEYNITRKYGRYIQGKYFHMFVLKPQNYTGPAKIGIVVSNKFHKRAVKRNKAKRIFREIIRQDLDKIQNDLWIVIHPKFSCLEKDYEEISSDFDQNLQKISITG